MRHVGFRYSDLCNRYESRHATKCSFVAMSTKGNDKPNSSFMVFLYEKKINIVHFEI